MRAATIFAVLATLAFGVSAAPTIKRGGESTSNSLEIGSGNSVLSDIGIGSDDGNGNTVSGNGSNDGNPGSDDTFTGNGSGDGDGDGDGAGSGDTASAGDDAGSGSGSDDTASAGDGSGSDDIAEAALGGLLGALTGTSGESS
ncbi:hypothetical protein Q5752_003420 [Cryptotrichosporon argae]